jgi:excinuclease UvrABC ATPase subunit
MQIESKICNCCKRDLSLDKFHKCKFHSTGRKGKCKECRKLETKKYFESNKDSIKEKAKIARLKNPDANKKYYRENPEYFKRYRIDKRDHYKNWRQKNRERVNENFKKRKRENPSYRIACNLRSSFSGMLKKRNGRKYESVLNLLGCSVDEFRKHLEALFTEGMSWDNYGKWHIDHIKPCSSFDLTSLEDQKVCFHFSNMQPLWAIDNIKKSNKM